MRLIDADYLKNLPFERIIHTDFGDTAIPIEEIDNAPTIIWCSETSDGLPLMDLRPRPQGEWIVEKDVYCRCPFCNFKDVKYSNYCPECGVRLRRGEE